MGSKNEKRIGFILSALHYGSSRRLWRTLASYCSERDGSLIIFSGGRLNSSDDPLGLKNKVYSLATRQNIDGLISWSSTICDNISEEEAENFHKKYADLPFVTIGQKIFQNPSVEFDAYTGMKELVKHFILAHGARKIVFLRGPQNHISAEDRFRGYKDALKEAGIEYSPMLVSDHFQWANAEAAIRQLYEDRHLVPGKDFDALVAPSDLMAFDGYQYLKNKGYKIPKDFIVGGFNDSVESRLSATPFSTVHMPSEKIGIVAYSMLSEMLAGNENVESRVLDAYPVIRESCGCNSLKSWISSSESKSRPKTQEQLFSDIKDIFRNFSDTAQDNIDKLAQLLSENSQADFFHKLTKVLTRYFEEDGELSLIFAAINILRQSNTFPEEYVNKISRTIDVSVAQTQARIAARKYYDNNKITSIVNTLKTKLLAVHDRRNLIELLAEYLPQIGIKNASVVLNENNDFSRYVGGFNTAGVINTEETLFSVRQLVPARYDSEFNHGVHIVQPLFMNDKNLGYLVLGYSNIESVIFEDLRSAISNTLQSIFLFEQINTARQIAEQAEFAKTEFFANVGSDLCDPLRELSAKLIQMETNINNGILDQDILSEQLIFLRSQIDAQLEKTQTLIDLTRSQVNDLPMDKRLFDIRQILPGSALASIDSRMPLIYGDPDRLKRALQSIYDLSESTMKVNYDRDGIKIVLESQKLNWQMPELLLAEKIILLQYGEIEKNGFSAVIKFPWPNLAGMPPLKTDKTHLRLIGIAGKQSDFSIFNLHVTPLDGNIIDNIENDDSANLLYWEADNSPIDEWVKIYGLRHYEKLFRAPVLCYSNDLIGHSFVELFEKKILSQKQSPVLFVNTKYTEYGTWATEANSVSIPSMDDFDRILNEVTPSIIVFESVDDATITRIRQNSKTVLVPILVLPESVPDEAMIEVLCSHPRIVLCNRGAALSDEFNGRVHEILAGDEILPPHTGALVKKAIYYMNKNAGQQIVRWKLADSVHVSEDYLTRIFHKELGLSLWEYLNRYRIYIATKMLLETNDTIYEIAEKSGFQDQAYFCRVFKKIYGRPPGKIRAK